MINVLLFKLFIILVLAAPGQAQYGPGGYWNGAGYPGGPQGSGFRGGPAFDVDEATRVRAIHGVLGAIAMVALFPGGSILIRLLPGKFALWCHAIAQMIALAVFAAAVGMGIKLVEIVKIPVRDGGNGEVVRDGSILANPNINYHPIIGLIVFACLVVQPILGIIHHLKFKKLRRRQAWSYLHLFNGRIFISLGIANGGFGLWLARASAAVKLAYIATAATVWTLWMLFALRGEMKRAKEKRGRSREGSEMEMGSRGLFGRKRFSGNSAF